MADTDDNVSDGNAGSSLFAETGDIFGIVQVMNNLSLTTSTTQSTTVSGIIDRSVGVKINGVHTDIIVSYHENVCLLLITQYQKIGCFVQVFKEDVLDNPSAPPVYVVKPMMGAVLPEQQAAARFIGEKLDHGKPFSIFLCLQDYKRETITAIVDVIVDITNKAPDPVNHGRPLLCNFEVRKNN